MRLIMRARSHRRLLRIYRALGKEIRCSTRMRFGLTMAALEVLQELMLRRSSWCKRGRKSS
jgi:hypothetical protein